MKKEVMINLLCKDCKKEYKVTEGEIIFYRDKRFPIPLRCPECRNKRKSTNQNKFQYFNNDLRS